jgi:hypothetical protein
VLPNESRGLAAMVWTRKGRDGSSSCSIKGRLAPEGAACHVMQLAVGGHRGNGAKSGPEDSRRWLRHPADGMNGGFQKRGRVGGKNGSRVMNALREPPPDPVRAAAAGA